MIKTFTFLLSFCFSMGNIYGQYEPMALEGAHWVLEAWSDTPGHHAFTIRGDSVINTLSYKKVYWQSLQGQIGQDIEPPYLVQEEKLFGLLRDDVAGMKVFFVPFEDYGWGLFVCEKYQDQLLYDFSIQPGGFAPLCTQYGESSPLGIDSVANELLWEKDRQLLYVTNGGQTNPPSMFIEGIGTAYGPFTSGIPILIFGAHLKLVDYCVGTDAECGFGVLNPTAAAHEAPVRIFPNPAKNLLHLDLPTSFKGQVSLKISSLTGQVFIAKSYIAEQSGPEEVNIENLPEGTYLLTLAGQATTANMIFVKM